MAHYDPISRSMLRMELRRFQTRCEALEGTIRRADSVRRVAHLSKVAIPFVLIEETDALDVRAQIHRTAEEKARELLMDMIGHYQKAEPILRAKLKRQIEDDILQLTGPLNTLRTWAQSRLTAADHMLLNND